jgi:hypothetical protein
MIGWGSLVTAGIKVLQGADSKAFSRLFKVLVTVASIYFFNNADTVKTEVVTLKASNDSVLVSDSVKTIQINALQLQADSLQYKADSLASEIAKVKKIKSLVKQVGPNTYTIGD